MSNMISEQEPSEMVKASPYLLRCWMGGFLPLEECEHRARGAQRLKEQYSCIPFYARQAENDPDYWHSFYASRVNW
jgi:hypothetical protein